MHKVEAVPVVIKGQVGYDIRVIDQKATVQDYIDAVNCFIENQKCFRSRQPEMESCFGCNLCCQERIPVTLVDALKLSTGCLVDSMERQLNVCVEGRVVDITMALDEKGRCLRLNGVSGTCRSYENRPMVCQTFICCPSTPTAKRLREEIVNAGEDELVRTWFDIKGRDGRLIMHDVFSPQMERADYPETAFSGADQYSQVKLKDVCSPSLWNKIVG